MALAPWCPAHGASLWEEVGVCTPVACWRRVMAATEGLGGRA